MQHICFISTRRHHSRHHGAILIRPRSRHSHYRLVRRWLLRRPISMGSAVRTNRQKTRLPDQLPGLHRLPSRLRALTKHRVYSHLPFPRWHLRSCTSGKQRVCSLQYIIRHWPNLTLHAAPSCQTFGTRTLAERHSRSSRSPPSLVPPSALLLAASWLSLASHGAGSSGC